MMLEERIVKANELLGTTFPIIQGGMAYAADSNLAAAVSNAGGLGVIAAGGLSADKLRQEIEKFKSLCRKNYAVNVALKDENVEEIFQVLREERVPIVITGAGNPEKYVVSLKEYGAKVIPVVASVALAKRLVRFGVDAVIAEGAEAGGHIGNTSTMSLVPQIADAIDIPIVAAGGIADGRGVAAAFMLGACAVQLGTRFLVTKECKIGTNYKEMIKKARDISTVVLNTTRPDRDNIRALKSTLANKYMELERTSPEDTHGILQDALRRAMFEEDSEQGLFMAGECAGLIKDEPGVEELLQSLWDEANRCLERK